MISKRLDAEVEPFGPVSKDHQRTNRNGINLDVGKSNQTFGSKRKSLDISAAKEKLKNKNFNPGSLSVRKLSHVPGSEVKIAGLLNTMQHPDTTRNGFLQQQKSSWK
jgi:hypothetical protein